jgi:hypothetical protein
MVKLKKSICEAHILLLHKNLKIRVNFTFFYEAELLKLRVFGN